MLALVTAVYLASAYCHVAATFLTPAFSMRPETAAALGYVVIFLAVMVTVAWGGAKLAQLIRVVHMSWADRLGGAIVGAALGALVAGFVVMGVMVVLPVDAPLIRKSQLAQRTIEYNHDLARFIPAEARDAYYYREAQVITYWNDHAKASPGPSSGPTTTP